jgi:hypothetical protein
MNYISCIIQILEIPKIESYSDNIEMVKFRVQLPYVRNKTQSPIIVNSRIWGDLGYDVLNYYRVNDYALVEGYLCSSSDNNQNKESITINITKLYPFLFVLESHKEI